MLKPGQNRKQRAFTLIELLVVIAIIAILAAILFPVFGRARENARRSSCMSNMKQIGLGIMQYTQDYDEAYPPAAWNPGVEQDDPSMPGRRYALAAGGLCASGYCVTWMDIIYPYVKSVQLFACPSARYDEENPSYGYSNAISARNITNYDSTLGGSRNNIPLKLAAVLRPAEIYTVVEYNYSAAYYANPYEVGRQARGALSNQKRVIPHLGGANVTFADGHVKWVNAQVIKAIPDVNTRCVLASPDPGYAYCDKNWNPLIP